MTSTTSQRRRVVLAVSPGTWLHLRNRQWGERQVIDEHPEDLEEGWVRLAFTTTGLGECRHWVFGLGAGVRAEGPPELIEWLEEEIENMAAAYGL